VRNNKILWAWVSFFFFANSSEQSEGKQLQFTVFYSAITGLNTVTQAIPFPISKSFNIRFPTLCVTFGQNPYTNTLASPNREVFSQ